MQTVEVELDLSETVVAEAGAMNWMEPDIHFDAKMGDGSAASGGLLNGLLQVGQRVLTGESIFMTHFTNQGHFKRRVAFSAPYPRKIMAINWGGWEDRLPVKRMHFSARKRELSIAGN